MGSISPVPLLDGWSMWSTASLRGTGFPVDTLAGLSADETIPALDAMLAAEEALRETAWRAKNIVGGNHLRLRTRNANSFVAPGDNCLKCASPSPFRVGRTPMNYSRPSRNAE